MGLYIAQYAPSPDSDELHSFDISNVFFNLNFFASYFSGTT